MITGIEIKSRAPFVDSAAFGGTGPYERIDGIASGALDPAHPRNNGIALLDQAPRNAAGLVPYRSDFVLLRPTDPHRGNGRLLYEVNNRGRIMLFANLCAGAGGNQPAAASELGNALPLRLGFSLLWTGWDPGAPKSTGLSLEVPTIEGVTKQIREEFISGTRLGVHEVFRLAYEATGSASVTVRRTQTAPRAVVGFEFVDNRTIRLLPAGTAPAIGSIYEVSYEATKPRVLGIGFAATRDVISHLRHQDAELMGRPIGHTLAFGISQAGRYLRDHIAGGFNGDENGRRVFDGVFTHVAGIGRVFHNTPFGQPFRTRTWHEDHDFPEVEFPFSCVPMDDPLSTATGSLMRGDGRDPKLIETNTSTEYWQKGASLLHTDPLATSDVTLPANVRGYLLTGTQHGGRAGMPRDLARAAIRAIGTIRCRLFERCWWHWTNGWSTTGPRRRAGCPGSTTVRSSRLKTWPFRPSPAWSGHTPPTTLLRWRIGPNRFRPPAPMSHWFHRWTSDGNERAGIRLPDIAVPRGTFTGWNLYRSPYPDGELADRDGTFLAFPATESEREHNNDPRPSIATRYPGGSYAVAVRTVTEALLRDRLLLPEDAKHLMR